MKDVDVSVLVFDAAADEHYCKQCAYAGKADEVEQLFTVFTRHRYKQSARPHPFAERLRSTP
jgi:hypothetical protein